ASSSVFTIILSTCSSLILRGAPGRCSSCSPSSRSSKNRRLHLPIVCRVKREIPSQLFYLAAHGPETKVRSATGVVLEHRLRRSNPIVLHDEVDVLVGVAKADQRHGCVGMPDHVP